MIKFMVQLVNTKKNLDSDERNLLSVAFKNTVGSRRQALRAISSISHKEDKKEIKNIQKLEEYKTTIETELFKFCHQVIDLIKNDIINECTDSES